jgi:CII-binding regulator of phage lambda lysogenization HflD
MTEDKRIIELLADILQENRKTNSKLEKLENKISHLEEEQKKTNLLLQQHSRDLVRIANSLDERVVHWGDKISIRGKVTSTQSVGVVSKVE